MKTLVQLFAVLTLFCTPLSAQSLDADVIEAIEEMIKAEMKEQSLVGLSVAIGIDGKLAWTKGFGLADLENDVPATEHTVYRMASISKPVTAAAVMQLAEQKKIDLDAPIVTYIPSWPEKKWPVTTRQLLTHQGGIRHYVRSDNMNNTKAYATATEALEYFADDPLIAEPGTRHSYSSYGYNLLGAIVEGASDMPFVDYVAGNVLTAAGTESMQDDSQSRIIKHRAQGYRKVDGEIRNSMLVDISYKVGGGGFCATAADLVRFAHAMQAGKIVKPESRDLMWTPQKTRLGADTDYGFGWGIAQRDGNKIVRHGGAQARVRTNLVYFVDDGLAVAAMCNSEWCSPPRITLPIARRLLSAQR